MTNNTIKKEELIQKIKEFRLLDDNFMSRVFDDNIECTELILRIILERQDIEVKEVHTQREIKNLRGHSVRLDIAATDINGEPINVEVQRAEKGAGAKRARYHSSIMDANTLIAGEEYDELPESYVIFITETDVMEGNLPIYHADRVVTETGKLLGDGAHIIYVNGAFRDDSPIGKLMHDFSCKNPSDMYYGTLAQQVRYFKEDEKGVKDMCKLVEDLINDEKREMIIKMKKMAKWSNEDIAEITGFSIEEVEAIGENSKLLV